MTTTKNKYIICIMFIILASVVYAAPPPFAEDTTLQEGGSVLIEVPVYSSYVYDSDIKLHFHVHNSTGFLLTDTKADCLIHLYNSTQSHINKSWLIYDAPDFEITFSKTQFDLNKDYQFIINCNTTDGEAGYKSSAFTITLDGQPRDSAPAPLLGILLFPVGLAFLFLFIGNGLEEDQAPLKWFFRFLSLLTIFVMLAVGNIVFNKFVEYQALSNIFNIEIFSWVFFTVVAVFLIYFIYKIFMAFKIKKQDDFEKGIIK